MSLNEEVRVALRTARLDAGITSSALADMMGVSIWTLSRVEHGARSFDPAWLDRMPRDVRTPVAALLAGALRDDFQRIQAGVVGGGKG